jgi:hypothetical protein
MSDKQETEGPAETAGNTTAAPEQEETNGSSSPSKIKESTSNDGSDNNKVNGNVQNSFSADSPYFSSYVDNEMKQMEIMSDTLKDIAARTKTMGKCGALMSESTRRLALACRLRRPYVVEDERDAAEQERQQDLDVTARRRAVGEDMTSLLGVMSEVCTFDLRVWSVCVCIEMKEKRMFTLFLQIFVIIWNTLTTNIKNMIIHARCWMK